MPTRIENILSAARITLADPNKERWSDDTLIAILKEGQIDFNQQTEFLRERVDITPVEGTPFFNLPDDCWLLTRVLYDGGALPMYTHREMDEMAYSGQYLKDFGSYFAGPDWEEETGSRLVAIIYDRTKFDQGKTYPIPQDLPSEEDLVDLFGVVVTESSEDDQFGVVISTTDAFDNVTYTAEDFGVVSSFGIVTTFLRCYYLKNPQDVTDINSTLDIPPMFDIALKFYVCGQAFLNDLDTGYQEKGDQQMLYYTRHVDTAKKTTLRNFVRAGVFETTYRTGFK